MIKTEEFAFGAAFDAKVEIDKARVTHSEIIKSSEVLLWIQVNGRKVPILTRGNIVGVLGKAKSRKTFFNAMMAGACINGKLYDTFFAAQKKLKVVFFDTEQGKARSQKVLKRIGALCNFTYDQIDMISCRPYASHERVELVDYYMETHKPDVVFIDGIRDLIVDFNNLTMSSELMTCLMRWSEAHNCGIICVLHMNKADASARGHLGSELMNKAETIIAINKEKDSEFSTVEPVECREMPFDSFQFTVMDGVPVVCGQSPPSEHNLIDVNARLEPNKSFDVDTEAPF